MKHPAQTQLKHPVEEPTAMAINKLEILTTWLSKTPVDQVA